ncbi:MAG TPA: ABC transporter substrate-binding protein, partial [Actinopolymorphaceae bacterium]
MARRPVLRARMFPAALAALALIVLPVACGGDGEPGQGEGEQTPRRGGTLKLVGGDDVDELDPASSYYTASSMLMRGYTRQLFSYRSSKDIEEAIRLAPDVATQVPTKANGGISADGLTYTIRLRNGVMWNTNPPREVTAEDFVLGIKRICNPSKPSGALHYYTSTIKGMQEF